MTPSKTIAATILVPAHHPTLQAGVTAAAPMDTVLVAPGIYEGAGNRDIDFQGKDVVLRSELVRRPQSLIVRCKDEEFNL